MPYTLTHPQTGNSKNNLSLTSSYSLCVKMDHVWQHPGIRWWWRPQGGQKYLRFSQRFHFQQGGRSSGLYKSTPASGGGHNGHTDTGRGQTPAPTREGQHLLYGATAGGSTAISTGGRGTTTPTPTPTSAGWGRKKWRPTTGTQEQGLFQHRVCPQKPWSYHV